MGSDDLGDGDHGRLVDFHIPPRSRGSSYQNSVYGNFGASNCAIRREIGLGLVSLGGDHFFFAGSRFQIFGGGSL
jgi:hypothetical protein